MLVRLYDTSALAKLYCLEPGTAIVETLVSEPNTQAVISQLARVEFESVLAIKARTGTLTAIQQADIRYRLAADFKAGRLRLGLAIQVSDYLLASQLLKQFGESLGLRTLDALHLSTALRAARQNWISSFVSADKRLCQAARAAGCPIIEVTAE